MKLRLMSPLVAISSQFDVYWEALLFFPWVHFSRVDDRAWKWQQTQQKHFWFWKNCEMIEHSMKTSHIFTFSKFIQLRFFCWFAWVEISVCVFGKKYNIHMQINKSIKYYTVCCHKKPHKLNQFLSITFMLHRRI